MAAGSTYTPIATTTLGTAVSSYTFSSIPSTYTDLILVASCQSTTSSNADTRAFVQVGNGSVDTGSNYSYTAVYGTGAAAGSVRESSRTQIDQIVYNATANNSEFGLLTYHFFNYSNTNIYKTVMQRANQNLNSYGTRYVATQVALWRSTSAIDTIKIYTGGPSAGNWSVGSTFTLYGIAAA
jgi:hypothetical protein